MKMRIFLMMLIWCMTYAVVYGRTKFEGEELLQSMEEPAGDLPVAVEGEDNEEDNRAPWDEDNESNEEATELSGEFEDSEEGIDGLDEDWVPDNSPIPATRIGATHYNWAPRTRRLVNAIIKRWKTRLNTYYDHPTGWRLDHVSIDCWDMKGRGYKLAKAIGDKITKYLLTNSSKWGVRWVIWYGRIWTPANGWKKYTDSRDMHYDHVHVTIR